MYSAVVDMGPEQYTGIQLLLSQIPFLKLVSAISQTNLFPIDAAVVFVPYTGYQIMANPIYYFPEWLRSQEFTAAKE